MLAIKECLIREGVLNLSANTPSGDVVGKAGITLDSSGVDVGGKSNYNQNIYCSYNHINGSHDKIGVVGIPVDMQKYKKSVSSTQELDIENNSASSNNNISSESATAKTSCQQSLKNRQPQEQSNLKKRYQGQHPHFHHHTAPAYYTDVNLRIHTPKAGDVAALNENYHSVYAVPSKLVGERHFPHTTTATVVPPPIGDGISIIAAPKTSTGSLVSVNSSLTPPTVDESIGRRPTNDHHSSVFRGGSAGNERKSLEHIYGRPSPTFAQPIKGELNILINPPQYTRPDGSIAFVCTNFKPASTATVQTALDTTPAATTIGRSRNSQRFSNRKRVVRVRSESRPISALYDIICKEKGLDIGTTTTNDEDTSAANSHEDDDNDDNNRAYRRFDRKSYPIAASASYCSRGDLVNTMSSKLDSPNSASGAYEHTKRSSHPSRNPLVHTKKKKDHNLATNMIINDLSHGGNGVGDNGIGNGSIRADGVGEGTNYVLKSSPKSTNLIGTSSTTSKASSLPPYLKNASELQNQNQNHLLHQHEQHKNNHNNHIHHHNHHHNHHHAHQQHNNESSACDTTATIKRDHDLVSNHNYAYPTNILYVEPVNLRLSDSPNNGSSAGANLNVAETPGAGTCVSPSPSRSDRGVRAGPHRRLREERRRHTDGAASMIPIATAYAAAGAGGVCDSDDEQERKYATNARRFITRSNRTRSHSRSSVNGGNSSHRSDDSSSPSPVHRCTPISTKSNSSTSLPVGIAALRLRSPALKSPLANSTTTTSSSNIVTDATVTNGNRSVSLEAQPSTVMTNSAVSVATVASNNAAAAAATTNAAPNVGHHTDVMTATVQDVTSDNFAAVISATPTQQQKLQKQRKSDYMLIKCENNNINNNNNNNNRNNSIKNTTSTAPDAFKQKAALSPTQTLSAQQSQRFRKNPLSPLFITPTLPASTPTPLLLPIQCHNQQNTQQKHLQPPYSPASPSHSSNSVHFVRTTKTTRLRAAALDKKKDDGQQQRYSSPTSPRHQVLQSNRRHSSSSDNQKSPGGSESGLKQNSSSSSSTTTAHRSHPSSGSGASLSKKLIPSVSVLVKQNLSELNFTGTPSNGNSPKMKRTQQRPHTTECTVRISRTPSLDVPSSPADGDFSIDENTNQPRPRCSTMITEENSLQNTKPANEQNEAKGMSLNLSPVHKSRTAAAVENTPNRAHHAEGRDKSSKRKSNLNRALNEEATHDGDETAALRRRRRRELGMARQLIPGDDPALREIISPKKSNSSATTHVKSPTKSTARSELAVHMENARRGLDLVSPTAAAAVDRRRAQTASPKVDAIRLKHTGIARISRRSDTLPLGELRKLRSNDVNRKVNERTKSDLAEIMKIAEMANANNSDEINCENGENCSEVINQGEHKTENPSSPADAINNLTQSIARLRINHERNPQDGEATMSALTTAATTSCVEREPSPAKHATFVEEESIYYEPEPHEDQYTDDVPSSNAGNVGSTLRQRMLKARSVDRDGGQEPLKLSPILRRKSTDDPSVTAPTITSTSHNHIVSILKKKDHIAGESSSASSTASPVTFSANVIDTPIRQKRAGILKKRSSLDESRYYSRSHSPDERSILIKSVRRNSLEDIAALPQQQQQQQHQQQQHQQHGILKQSSYDSSKSDGCPSATEPLPHGILKKKDSTTTPSDGGSHAPKHVSISQAVILAAAELGRDATETVGADYEDGVNEEYEIRPILKIDSTSSDDAVRPPKPILKKKSSGDSDEHEIRPILKTSRKSSREEFDLSGVANDEAPSVRPILKTDSPSKRRSLGGEMENVDDSASPSFLKRRTRSLERQESPVVDLAAALNAIATSQMTPAEFDTSSNTNMSVSERIKCMEKYLNNQQQQATPEGANTSWDSPLQSGAVPKLLRPSAIKRDFYRDRYKTQPVTNDEKSCFKANTTTAIFDTSAPSAFKPTKSLDALNYVAFANLHTTQSNVTPVNTEYTLARSSTQPLQQPYRPHQHTPPTSGNSNNTIDNSTSVNNDDIGERAIEMSGIDQQQQQDASVASSGGGGGAGGIVRKDSVRARANMFQQMQEKAKTSTTSNREERTSTRRAPAPQRMSPPPAQEPNSIGSEPKTTTTMSTQPDEEIESSHLPPPAPPSKSSSAAAISISPPGLEPIKSILKSRSGCVGFMPKDLSSELKNRLKSSKHASVTNLRNSATSATVDDAATIKSSSSSDETKIEGGSNLASILRNVSKENIDKESATTTATGSSSLTAKHDDAVNLVRNLSNLGRPSQLPSTAAGGGGDNIASTSEGESSGGREVSEIIKNSAVARRRKLNDGNLIAKSKSQSSLPPPGAVSIGIGPQLPPIGSGGFVKLRHVEGGDRATTITATTATDSNKGISSEGTELETAAQSRNATALPAFLQGGLRRSLTQVMGPDQSTITISKTGSIADRLAALQKSGEEDWKRRILKQDEVDEICRENLVNESLSLAHSLSDKPLAQSPLIPTNLEGGKVSERLGKLKTSSESWKNRVEQSDASKFTIAGRLQKKAQSPIELQFERALNAAAKKCPLQIIRSANQPLLGLAKSPSMMVGTGNGGPTNGTNGLHTFVQRSISANPENIISDESNHLNSDSDSDGRSNEKDQKNKLNNNSVAAAAVAAAAAASGARVVIPKLDDEETFEKFFASKKPTSDDSVEISDFDNIKSTERLVTKRTVQGPKGRRAARNPLKSLATRSDISAEYTEFKSGIAEREMRRIKLESYGQRGNLAAEAIAGLASVEDFKSVALKSSSLPLNKMWLPYKPVMLLHVKGRTHVQTRLVEPTYTSLNRGDCFILVAGSELYRYVGSFANVIEISRSKKICAYIVENKDLGCSANSEVVLTDGKLVNEQHWKKFWQILGKPDEYAIPDCGHADEDDIFEASLIETNKIYEFQDDSLVPMEKYWGSIPKVEMLNSRKVIIFDFGSELYVWNGKNAAPNAKRAAIKLTQEHFDTAVADYSKCYVNPLNYATLVGSRDSYKFLKRCEQRGDWCILGKISQNMETGLFKEKFCDWPEVEREDLEKDYLSNGVNSIKPLDGLALFEGEPYAEPNLVLENANLGRGNFYYDNDTMRHFDVITKSTDKWQINEFNFDSANEHSYGHFYSAESYIVRWIYQISVTVRELSGKVSNRSTVGRDRCVYFCWQGNDASANEKGAAALLTVELDKEKGAQMRVAQGDESTAFIRLFKLMFHHKGRKDECLKRRNTWRLYQLIGNEPDETLLKEVDCHAKQLRSRASMLLVHGADGIIYIWHGCQSAKHTRQVAENAADTLCEHKPEDIFTNASVSIKTVEEGKEPSHFIEALGVTDLCVYGRLSEDCIAAKDFNYTPRLFHFSSTQGVFSATELLFALRKKDLHSPYPFTQSQLYNARQPTIFMLDDGDFLWLWMGWWPPSEDIKTINAEERSSPTNDNRAGVNRWISERRAALETAVSYWRAKFGDNDDEKFHGIKGNVVWAGLEPLDFKALFPDWSDRDDVREINMQDGRTDEATPIVDVLTQLTQTEYPLDVLKGRPLPEGVDPSRLELYLNEGDFEMALGITCTEFEQMPLWKQTNLKKERGLF